MAKRGLVTLKQDLLATSNALQMQATISAGTSVFVERIETDTKGRRIVFFLVYHTLYLAYEKSFDQALT